MRDTRRRPISVRMCGWGGNRVKDRFEDPFDIGELSGIFRMMGKYALAWTLRNFQDFAGNGFDVEASWSENVSGTGTMPKDKVPCINEE